MFVVGNLIVPNMNICTVIPINIFYLLKKRTVTF